MVEDAIERTNAKEVLEEENQLTRTIIAGAHEGIIVYDRDLNYRVWNRFMEELTGMPAEKVLGKSALKLFPHLAEQGVDLLLKRALAGETGASPDVPFHVPGTGKSGWVSGIYGPHRNAQGEIVGVIGLVRDITERKRYEEAIRLSEEKYRTLFETMLQGVVYQDADGRIVSANPAAEKILGLTLDQMRGRTSTDPRWKAIHEDGSDFPGETHPSMIALRTRKEVRNVVMGVFDPKTGEHRWININAVPQFKPGETRPYQVYTTFEDITERKQAEERLRQSVQDYNSLFDRMLDGMYRSTHDGRFIDVNSAFVKMFGYSSKEEMLAIKDIGKELYFSPGERGSHVLDTGREEVEVYRMRRKDGSEIWVEDHGHYVHDDKGNIVYHEGMLRDVTERKRAEETLRESETRYRTLFDTASDAIFIHDMGRNFLEVNQVACERLGYSRDELLRMTPKDIQGPEYAQFLTTRLNELLKAGHAIYETVHMRRDGTPIPTELSSRIIEYRGKPAVLSIARDITERRLAEQKLRLQGEITENMSEGVVITRASDGIIVYTNPRLEQIFGYESGELIGKHVTILNAPVNGRSPEDTAREIEASLNESGGWVGEIQNIKKDGTHFWCRVSTSVLESSEYGRIWVSVQEDITERKRTAEKLDAIHKHSAKLGAENTIDGIVSSTLDAIEDTLGFHYAEYEEVRDGFLQVKEARGIPATLKPLPLDGPGIIVKVARTKKTIRIPDTRSEPSFLDTGTKLSSGKPVQMLSELAVPVIVNGSVVAVLNVESARLGAFTESDQVLLETLAMHVSSAIARLEQINALRNRAEELRTLQAIVLDITASHDLPTLLERIVERAARLLGVESGGMYLCDPEKREARCVVSYNTLRDYRGVVLKYGEGAAGRVAETGRPLMVDDYRLWEGRAEVYEKDRPFSALLSAPMISQDRVIGVIHVMERSKARKFTQADLEMLTLFANHASIAVERMRTETKLRESEERYRMMFRSMGDAVAVYEVVDQGNDFVFRDFNEAAERIEKVKSEDVIGKSVLEVFPGVKNLGLFEVFQRVWKTGKPEHLPARIYKDKRIVGWRENYVYKLPSGELVAVYQDVTDRKRLEEELRQYSLHLEKLIDERTQELRSARQRLENVISSNPAVIYSGKPLADQSDFVLTYLSDRVVATLGFEPSRFIGHPEFWEHHVHPEDVRRVLTEMPRLWKEGQCTFEYRFLHRDGTYHWLREEANVVRDANGKPTEVYGYWTDVTERRRMEQRLAESERLAAIGQTAAMVGHDLRNPLQGIAGVVYLAKRNLESRKIADKKAATALLETIQEQITYMDKIVSDLQDYAQPLVPKLTQTNLPNLIAQMLSTIKIPETTKVSIGVENGAENSMIDPTLMRRTLTNLTINAIQAMPRKGKLTIRARRKGDSTIITVRDTGMGVPRKNLDKLFSPFFTTKAKGQGLGLAVCKRLVEVQGGTITVKSKLRKGTSFTIKLPQGTKEVAS